MEIGTLGDCVTVAPATCTGTGVLEIVGNSFYYVSTTGLAVLTAVVGVAIAYFLFKWGFSKVKGAVR